MRLFEIDVDERNPLANTSSRLDDWEGEIRAYRALQRALRWRPSFKISFRMWIIAYVLYCAGCAYYILGAK